MNGQNDVANQMQKIRECFLHAQHLSVLSDNFDDADFGFSQLIIELEKTELEFRSVAYEAVSMELALKDIAHGNSLLHWRHFMEGPGAGHGAQVHVGLGWALAQQHLSPGPFTHTLRPLLAQRVLDGYGYYDGIFRSRQTVTNQLRSAAIPDKYFQAYDLGIGRSLWYRTQGDHLKISELISRFSIERRSSLWLGIGIACTYVGGFTQSLLEELMIYSGDYHTQLAIGAALAARARIQAKSNTAFAELACRLWCNCSATDAMSLTTIAEPSHCDNPDIAFKIWLSQIELAIPLR